MDKINNANHKYYVYLHRNDTYGVFYVGKGSGKRFLATGNRSHFWKCIVKKYGYTAHIEETFEAEEDAFEREQELIAMYKKQGQCQANFSMGGDGVRVEKRWWGEAISAAMKGIYKPFGPENKSYKHFASKEQLLDKLLKDRMSATEIAAEAGVAATTVYERMKYFGIAADGNEKKKKPIVCTTTGEEFESISCAARACNVLRENIRKVLSGKYKTTGGLSFQYKE